ncbi:MAG: hypothetical protein KGO53_02760 [Alphaproteobacteria bacterium]|nr:hypothetical protein [Alphaproteobacteria bacterium]
MSGDLTNFLSLRRFETSNGVFEIQGNPGKLFFALTITTGILGASMLMYRKPYIFLTPRQPVTYIHYIGALATAFFGFMLLLIVYQLLRWRSVIYRFSPEGFWCGGLYRNLFIPWSIVRDVKSHQINTYSGLARDGKVAARLFISEMDYRKLNRDRFDIILFRLTSALAGYPGVNISSAAADITDDELFELAHSFGRKHSPYMKAKNSP